MGDMKTPDFDDLLAAFDIPDIDANEAIQSHQEEPEAPGKALPGEPGPGAAAAEPALPHADISAVSVIVKNTVCPEQAEPKDGHGHGHGHGLAPRLLQNGFGSEGARPAEPAPNGDCWAKEKGAKGLELFSPFSPEPGHDGADLIDRKAKDKAPAAGPAAGCKEPLGDGPEGLEPPFPAPFRAADGAHPVPCIKKEESEPEEAPGRGCSPKGLALDHLKSVTVRYPAGGSPAAPWPAAEPAALDGGTGAGAELKHSPGSPREPFSSPGVPVPPSPKQLSLKEEREVLGKAVGSPPSASSAEEEEEEEEESTNSPSSSSSRPLKVRIKTIKTSCGSITRTVTRVSSDSEPPCSKVPSEQSSQEPLEGPAAVPAEAAREKSELSSPLKSAEGPKIVSVQLGNGTKLKGTVLPVATIQSASSAMLIAASVAQQKSVVLPAKAGKSVAKNILSLVPQPLPKGDARANGGAKAGGGAKANVAGTVISRSQSSLVEAFNKILNSKNLLPTYKPNLSPPAEASLALPPAGFRCLECGDAFALEKSLARHYDRRSMRIEVTCNHCTKRLVFFNKCSLLLHAREHKDKGLVMQCSHLVMRPIALEQMIGQPDVTALAPLALPAARAAQEGGAGPELLPVLPLGSEPGSYSCFRCLECKEQCKDKAGLAAHFQQAGTGSGSSSSSSSTVCSACPMILANRCSFSAHQRMHRSRPPHVCPECGGNFLLANFESHLKESCLHFSRRVGYRCPSCSVVFGGVNSIKSHIQSSHCEVFHKCPICPMAFKSAPSAHAHVYTQHPGFSNQQSKMIYKCAMCDTVFTHKPLLSSHFDQHLLPQRVSVFRCPQCPLLFAQKRTMLEHLKNTHQAQPEEPSRRSGPPPAPKAELPEPPRRSGSSSSSSEEEEEEEEEAPSSPELRRARRGRFPRGRAGAKAKGSGWSCGLCHAWFPERDEYVAHMKREHGKSVKKFPCHLCERSFCSAPSLRRHVRVNHEGIKRVYPCRYCTEGKRTFSSRLILEKHIQVRHGLQVTDPARSQQVVTARGPPGPSQAPGRRRKLSSEESCSEEPDSTTPPAKSPRAPLRCRKCGLSAGSRAELQAHLAQHRPQGAPQCRECGLCFTSASALGRHRFISHKKRRGAEPEEPAGAAGSGSGNGNGNGSGSGAAPGGNGGGSSAEGKLECKVCGRGFESQLNLKTHFRTHGMAFIRARQGNEEN